MSVMPIPAVGPSGVYRNSKFLLQFDDYPDPDVLPFGSVNFTSGAVLFDTNVSVRLVDRAIEVRPRSLLIPNNRYLVQAIGVSSLGGRSSPASGLSFEIAVGQELAPTPSDEPPLRWATDVAPRLASCATAGCHTKSGGNAPARSLVLDGDPRDPIYGVIGVASRSLRDNTKRLTRVAPGDAARSVLLRKLLGGDPSDRAGGEPFPQMAIDGDRMPPWPASPVDDATLRLVEAWIDGGALD